MAAMFDHLLAMAHVVVFAKMYGLEVGKNRWWIDVLLALVKSQ